MPRADITVVVNLRLLPDYVEEGKRDLLDFARLVRRYEPECSAIEITQDLDDPTLITMIEKWSDREVYVGPHQRTDHMRAFIDRAGGYFDGPPTIAFSRGLAAGQNRPKPSPPYGR